MLSRPDRRAPHRPAVPFAPTARQVVGAVVSGLLLTACAGSGVRGTPGAAGLRDPYFRLLGNGDYDVTHYGIELAYDPDERELTGEAVITAKAGKSLSAFNLDLHGLDVESVTVDDKAARFNRAADELTIRPDDELPEGRTFVTRVRYSGEPQTITDEDGSEEGWLPTDDGALALGEPTGSKAWFPGNHHPSDKAAYDIEITVPEGLEAISNGELTSEKSTAGRTTFTWHSGEPMASYLATVAIGPYGTKTSKTDDGLPVFTAVDPAEAEQSADVLARIPEIMKWSEGRFGPYPFSSTGAIVDREGAAGYALETQTKPVFPGAPDLETLVHELAHQWYGNSVTPKSWQDMWLNEGFATYAEWLWEEDHGGDTAQETFDALYEGDDTELWAYPPAEPTDASVISDAPVYGRGAMVLHKIRESVGDRTFFALIKGWAAEYRHGNADTADFTAYAEKTAGRNLDAVWGPWLYGEGKPKSP
ncbi:M1 family metallopeptidase [Streptomyces sp. N35]|uniref:M1 family metallopeptidase n=1 Tax=Streptomyces sp. N35 TaxID=2795730 RepID=UPI0018F469AD|nr:M1 family metallopeptidase [Streptomyces sp. N35]